MLTQRLAAIPVALFGGLLIWRPADLLLGPFVRMGAHDFARRKRAQLGKAELVAVRVGGVCVVVFAIAAFFMAA